jgi:hypothetical protein
MLVYSGLTTRPTTHGQPPTKRGGKKEEGLGGYIPHGYDSVGEDFVFGSVEETDEMGEKTRVNDG